MSKLKLGPLVDERPVKLAVELPAAVHRDLLAYAAVLAGETGGPPPPPEKLVAPMLARFMATDRVFRARRAAHLGSSSFSIARAGAMSARAMGLPARDDSVESADHFALFFPIGKFAVECCQTGMLSSRSGR